MVAKVFGKQYFPAYKCHVSEFYFFSPENSPIITELWDTWSWVSFSSNESSAASWMVLFSFIYLSGLTFTMLTEHRCVDILYTQANYYWDWQLRTGFEGTRQNTVKNWPWNIRNKSEGWHQVWRLFNLCKDWTKVWGWALWIYLG